MVLDEKLDAGEVVVLDGAIGSEIERLGGKMDAAAWCGMANVTHPDTVRSGHESYLAAGSNVVTANTFATCRHVLDAAGAGDETEAINHRAVELAREAIERVEPAQTVAIAGSMSNNMAWSPGSIGTDPKFAPSWEHEGANYREMANILADAGCDLLVLEMLSNVDQGCLLTEAALSTGLPVWVGISTSMGPDGKMVGWQQANEESSDRLPDDFVQEETAPLETLIDTFASLGPQAIGLMHSSVPSTTSGLPILLDRWDGLVTTYPETTGFDATDKYARGPIKPEVFAEHCKKWVESGVQVIGGCCGTTIYHIRAMIERLPKKAGSRSQVSH